MVSGASNIIVQNIEITNLNPRYVWGGDAITLNDVDLVWIDHVTVRLVLDESETIGSLLPFQISQIGRQQLVLGTLADARVSVTYNNFDGTGCE